MMGRGWIAVRIVQHKPQLGRRRPTDPTGVPCQPNCSFPGYPAGTNNASGCLIVAAIDHGVREVGQP